jgi:hypothetical protein
LGSHEASHLAMQIGTGSQELNEEREDPDVAGTSADLDRSASG